MRLLRSLFSSEKHTESYAYLTEQMKATGRQYGEGYDPNAWDCLSEGEKEQLEGKIWRKFSLGDLYIAVYLPKLRCHDGIAKLATSLTREAIAERRAFLADVLYRATGDGRYLDVMHDCCRDERGSRSVAVSLGEYPTDPQVEAILRDIFLHDPDEATQTAALVGILHQRGLIRDVNDYHAVGAYLRLARGLFADDPDTREALLDDFLEREAACSSEHSSAMDNKPTYSKDEKSHLENGNRQEGGIE